MNQKKTEKELKKLEDCRVRLQALINIFAVTTSQIAKAAQVSRPMVSRVLHGDQGVNANYLYSRLEKNLSKLIDLRQKSFFPIETVNIDDVKNACYSINPPCSFHTLYE